MSARPAAPPSRWLRLVRIVVLAWIVFSLGSLVVSLPAYYEQRRRLEPGEVPGSTFYGWTGEQLHAAMAELGLSPEVIAGALFVSSLVSLACFLGVAGLLLWRKSDTWLGLLAAYVLFSTGHGFSGLLLSQSQLPPWARSLYSLAAVLVWPTFFIMLYLFPTGKFVPRFTGYLAVVPYLLFFGAGVLPPSPQVEVILQGVLVAYALGVLASQMYRYRKVSSPVERQQTKWVVAALGVLVSGLVLTPIELAVVPGLALGTPARFLYDFITNGIFSYLGPALIPLAIGVAILRYRLWDIDVLIRRILIYSVLTGLLALAYFGSVVVLEGIFRTFTGQGQNQLVTVVSTLAIAALFVPLRGRVQAFIDRRFYRRKYDAARTLTGFAAGARDDVELEHLSSRLVEVVQDSMQPAHVSLWLKPPAAQREAFTVLKAEHVAIHA